MSFVGIVELLVELIEEEANYKQFDPNRAYCDCVRDGVEQALQALDICYDYEYVYDENYPLDIKKITVYDAEFCPTEKELKPLKKGSRKYED